MIRSLIVCAMAAWLVPGVRAEVPFGDRVVLRGELANARAKFSSGGRGRVAFLGGSITEMDGYRPMVCEILKRRFPETEFSFISAGISSTTSIAGAFRLERDVFGEGPVDLLFVEFAVNDDQDGRYSRQECIRGMEGILRHARLLNPRIDIVMTHFVNEGMLATYDRGAVPTSIAAHEAVARHYGVSTIHMARQLWLEIEAGTFSWSEYGGVHPAPAGNAKCAGMIDELFRRAWGAETTPPTASSAYSLPAEPLDRFSYFRGRCVPPDQAEWTAGWSISVPDWGALPGEKRERFSSIPMLVSTTVGATLELSFEGACVGANIVAGPDAGMVEVRIDDGPVRTLDLYHDYSRGLHYPRTLIFADELPAGRHRLRLSLAEEARGAGQAIRIIEFVTN
ncbi:MAG: GDSL-type esterase/lipase family protein [Verrucomicrobiota bacterium]|nr:GDSL-type esterase/lipase family protein [Verrucomicrobiota bacterium]